MSPFEIRHNDPHPAARAAAVRTARERDPALVRRAREQTMAERLRESFRLSKAAARLRDGGR